MFFDLIHITTIVIILILILIYLVITSPCIYNQLISGFYEADASFCKEAGIDMFSIFLDKDLNSSGSRACYILMLKNNELVLNEPTVATISIHQYNWNNWSLNPSTEKTFTISFDNINEEFEEVFPKTQTLKFYPDLGKIIICNEDTITGIFYKNGFSSEIGNLTKNIDTDADDDESF